MEMHASTLKPPLLTLVPWSVFNMINPRSYVYYVAQLLGIAKGLHYLHTHQPSPIFHGDLKGVCRGFLSMFCLV